MAAWHARPDLHAVLVLPAADAVAMADLVARADVAASGLQSKNESFTRKNKNVPQDLRPTICHKGEDLSLVTNIRHFVSANVQLEVQGIWCQQMCNWRCRVRERS